jgi:hypothetical protein
MYDFDYVQYFQYFLSVEDLDEWIDDAAYKSQLCGACSCVSESPYGAAYSAYLVFDAVHDEPVAC